MKKRLSLLLSIIMLVSVITGVDFSSYAAEYDLGTEPYGDNVLYGLNIDGSLTVFGTGDIADNKSHTFLQYQVKSITIQDGITGIGEGAFNFLFNLESVSIPNTVTRIGDNAFCGCISLPKIDIPSSVTKIGACVFADCSSLAAISVDKDNPVYDSRNNCNAIIETSSNTLISGCNNTVIPNGVKNISDYSFCGSISLTEIDIPDSVDSIGNNAFTCCQSLTEIIIPEGVTSIGFDAFDDCKELKTVSLPNSITELGLSIFSFCENLTSINIPNKLTCICAGMFGGCKSLPSIYIPKSIKSIETEAFSCCDSLTDVYYEGSEEDWEKIVVESGNDCLTGATIHFNCDDGSDNEETTEPIVNPISIKDANVSKIENRTYTGKAIKPAITVKLAGNTLKEGTDYTVKYTNCKNVGTAKVAITGIDKYKGTLEKTFKIIPKPTELKKVTAGKKSFKAYWKKRDVKTYQLEYSTYKSFKNSKKRTFKTTAKTVKNLKANKRYYVRVRTYKTINGKKYYSKWSEVKSVKTK